MTQGLLTITDSAGEVLFKVIVGCDGYNVGKLKSTIKRHMEDGASLTLELLKDSALEVGFGCEECLVIMSREGVIAECPEELDERYRKTFFQPRFNPRWECGIAERFATITI